MTDKIILVVSFGTSYNNNRALTIGAIEKDIDEAFPDYEMRRAFTSQMVINILKKRDDVDKYIDKFENIPIAEPLLISDEDFEDLIASITSKGDYDDDTAVVFMGHGSPAESNIVYTKLQGMLKDKGFDNYYIGTVEAKPDYDDVLAMVKEGDYKKIVLKPLMVVAGDHAQNDMAGDEDDSWKSMFASEGYEVECVIEGLAQSKDIRDVYIKHVQNAIDGLN